MAQSDRRSIPVASVEAARSAGNCLVPRKTNLPMIGQAATVASRSIGGARNADCLRKQRAAGSLARGPSLANTTRLPPYLVRGAASPGHHKAPEQRHSPPSRSTQPTSSTRSEPASFSHSVRHRPFHPLKCIVRSFRKIRQNRFATPRFGLTNVALDDSFGVFGEADFRPKIVFSGKAGNERRSQNYPTLVGGSERRSPVDGEKPPAIGNTLPPGLLPLSRRGDHGIGLKCRMAHLSWIDQRFGPVLARVNWEVADSPLASVTVTR